METVCKVMWTLLGMGFVVEINILLALGIREVLK
jgi:hypothetical protein